MKPFRFLNFWCNHNSSLELVQKNWQADCLGNPFMMLHAKLNRVKKALRSWSKETHSNIFTQKETLEDIINANEVALEIGLSLKNRTELKKIEADLRRFVKLGEEFWKQKAGIRWFNQGDRNTKFFHSYVKGKRRKLYIHEIHDEIGEVLKGNLEIRNAAVFFFLVNSSSQWFKVKTMTCWN